MTSEEQKGKIRLMLKELFDLLTEYAPGDDIGWSGLRRDEKLAVKIV